MQDVRRIPHARHTLIACGVALLWAAGSALADEPQHDTRPPPTKEQREKMAEAHEKMAACLRSDKAIEDCHSEMMKEHDAMMMHHHSSNAHPPAAPAPN